jgi:lauroyl/myristoyl acyltransferase
MISENPKPTSQPVASNESRPATYSWRQRLVFVVVFFVAFQIGRVLIFLARRQSWEKSHRISLWISRRVESLTRKTRWANFKFFFGAEKSPAELTALDEAHTRYLARMRADVAAAFGRTSAQLLATTELVGQDNLRAVLEKQRGVMLVSGHTATWWLVPSILSCSGFPVTVIFTPVKSKAVENKLRELTDRFGVKLAFVGRDAVNAMRRAVAKNEIIYLTFDVTMRPKHVANYRFGQAFLPVDSGPAIMATRSSMPLLQAECSQLDLTRRRISFYAPTELELNPQAQPPEALCELWVRRLAAEVATRPEQWWAWGYVDLLATAAVAQPSVDNSPKAV